MQFNAEDKNCRSSRNPAVQIVAFQRIISYVVESPSHRHKLRSRSEDRGVPVEATIFAWKATDIRYGTEWLQYYGLVSLCLTENPMMDAIAQTAAFPYWNDLLVILDSCTYVAPFAFL